MRKAILIFLVLTILLSAQIFSNSAKPQPQQLELKHLTINGKVLASDIKIIDGQPYGSITEIAEALGLKIETDFKDKAISLTAPAPTVVAPAAPDPEIEKRKEYSAGAEQALQAFEVISSVTGSGISKMEYSRMVADARVELSRFTNKYSTVNKIASKLRTALSHFEYADVIWDKGTNNPMGGNGDIPLTTAEIDSYKAIYPDMEKYITSFFGFKKIPYKSYLSVIWEKANSAVKEARLEFENEKANP